MSEGCSLYTPEQEEIIGLPREARAIVDAAAGTGKTHVLAGRLTHLINRDGLSAGDEVLVLSFSRAAVSELRARVAGLGGDARFVGTATFDAFATQLLATELPDDSWMTDGYDQRIRSAVYLLKQPVTPQLLTMVQHVLVDEVQDLVGLRASMVMALLSRLDAGFTLFGDPAQAIYGHQLRAEGDGPSNQDLYCWLTESFGDRLSRRTLTRDFRGKTDQAPAITDIGVRLRGENPDQPEIASALRTVLLRLPTTTIAAARRILSDADRGTSAVLCRTNAEALRMSAELFELGVMHRYQRPGEDRAAAGWLSRALSGIPDVRTTRSSLVPSLERIAEAGGPPADELFSLIRRLDPARGDGVDLQRIANRLREGSFPEELNDVTTSPVVVSTIHRAKGLEFDRVFLCAPRENDDADVGEENRLLYVALCRARYEVFHIARPNTASLGRDRRTSRWVRHGWGANRWKVYEVEVLERDSDSSHPAGTWQFEDDARALQEYLAECVTPGDPVELLLADPSPGESAPSYFVIRHGGRPVGATSDEFGSLLQRLLGPGKSPPVLISGLHVELVDSVAGNAMLGRQHGLGAHGIWGRLRVFGLGTLCFGRADQGGE
jgi:hypothetical protein